MIIKPDSPTVAAALDEAPRTVTGLAVPFGIPGRTSGGAVTVTAGAIRLPDDLSQVKLLRDHSTQPGFTPVGYATAAEETAEGLRMSFRIGATADGDTALADVKEGIRDAFSVELIDVDVNNGVLKSGLLTAVALVPIPAFAAARVTSITAAAEAEETDETESDTFTRCDDENCPHTGDDETDTNPEPEGTPVNTNEPKETAPAAPPVATAAPAPAVEETEAAAVPAGIVTAGMNRGALTFDGAVSTICAMRMGTASADMTAALADIKRSANPAVSAPQWLGQLWDEVEYTREIIPTMTQKALTSMKAVGWRWVTRPEIEDYAGDKAEIPTNEVETEAVEVTANRMAVGHDIDRAYFDFNETGFLTEFFKARVNSYAEKSDMKAATFLATSAATGTLVDSQPDLLHAAARARMLVKKQTRREPTAYLVNGEDILSLFDITQLDNPAYLDLLGVQPEKFITNDNVPKGTLIAYAKQAVTWFELPGSPIRVDAERVDHGGIDSGVFAYWATLLNDQRGIVSVPFATGPGLGE